MRKLKLLFAALTLFVGGSNSAWAETDYTSLMSSDWTGSSNNFGGGRERYQEANYNAKQKVMYQSFTAPAAGIYEIKFYAVTSCTASRYSGSIFGDNIAQAYATAGNNKATVAMTVINQTGCTLVADANIRTLSVEAAQGETIEYGIENIAEGGNWYTIKELSAKMKTVAEIFQDQYDEAYAIWQYSTENEDGARTTFKAAVDAMNTALSGTLADAQTASDNLAAALVTYESKSYPIKGNNVKYDFTNKMNMDITAWTCKQGNGPAQYGFTGATETYGGTAAGEVMYQTITGLANGEYEIHFYAVANAANGGGVEGTKTTVYANDQELEIDVIKQNGCTPSDYERTFTVMVKDGTLKYGIKNTVAAGNWYLCKNVALYMTGAPDLSDYYDAISEKLTTANGLKSSPMKATVLTALQDAIDATEGYTSITVTSTLETLSANLTTAITNANTSIDNYTAALTILNAASSLDATVQTIYAANTTVADLQTAYDNRTLDEVTSEQETECASVISNYGTWTTLKEYADALVAVPNDNIDANSTLSNAISTQSTAVSGATTAVDIATATSTLKDAMITYAGAANPTSGNKFDLTFMLTNPDLTGLTTWAPANGWAGENTGNSQVMQSNDVASDDNRNYFYEFWSYNPYENGKFNLYLSVELPQGTYDMECLAFAQCAGNTSTGGQTPVTNGITFSANETDGSYITSTVLNEASLTFVNETTQNVKIGLKAQSGNNRTWMGIGYVKLYKVTAQTFEIDEKEKWDNTASGAGDVTLNRTIKAGFNTLVLPFSMTQTEVETTFGSDSKVYVASSYNAKTDNISFTTHDGISPNMPCLLEATEAGTSYTIQNRTIVASEGEPVANGNNVSMTGTYLETMTVPEGSYIISNNMIYLVDSEVALKGTRAYISIESGSNNGARTLTMSFDDTATGIATLKDGKLEFETGDIYDLSGRKVKNPTKGIYLMNGKKVIK